MEKGRLFGVLALAVITAVMVEAEYSDTAAERQEAAEYRALLEVTSLAQVEGETLSPDGRFCVETAGRTETYISGLIVPETLQVTDTDSGEVLWRDQGWLTQSAAWSPDSRLLALAYSTRTQSGSKIVDTQTWTDWDFTLPDGSPIPEYVFFPEDWARWRGDSSLEVTLGRGDGEEPHTYRCSMSADEGVRLTGSVLEETAEVLSEDYDFDHDGVPETTEIVTVWESEGDRAAWHELWVTTADGELLWNQEAAEAHVGWTSLFALEVGDQDYLLRYDPYMGQGSATYAYQIFSLDETGAEQVLRENNVDFDINFGSPYHEGFDAAALADFLEEVHGYLDQSTLLLSTEGGKFCTGGSGAEFRLDTDLLDSLCPYDETRSLRENLENLERFRTAARQAAEIA